MPLSADRLTDHTVARSCEVVSGAAMLLRRSALPPAPVFDEGSFMYEEDTVLCRRVRDAGWEVWFEPAATLLHHGGASSPRTPRLAAEFYRNRVRYFARYGTRSQCIGSLLAIVVGLTLRPLLALVPPRPRHRSGLRRGTRWKRCAISSPHCRGSIDKRIDSRARLRHC